MTDKKYEELLKCAGALIADIEGDERDESSAMVFGYVRCWGSYDDLKACLPPPRLEIADKLDACYGECPAEGCYKWIKHAIEELRK